MESSLHGQSLTEWYWL